MCSSSPAYRWYILTSINFLVAYNLYLLILEPLVGFEPTTYSFIATPIYLTRYKGTRLYISAKGGPLSVVRAYIMIRHGLNLRKVFNRYSGFIIRLLL